jgi:hypothetical protein
MSSVPIVLKRGLTLSWAMPVKLNCSKPSRQFCGVSADAWTGAFAEVTDLAGLDRSPRCLKTWAKRRLAHNPSPLVLQLTVTHGRKSDAE